VTQKPSEFFITLANDLSASQFAALANSAAELLQSIPEYTQQASSQPEQGEPFLSIRAREADDDNEEGLWHAHLATFMMEVEDERAFFWKSVHAETWFTAQDGMNMEQTELESLVTTHDLGPYKRMERRA
jgi:hypothetical protein